MDGWEEGRTSGVLGYEAWHTYRNQLALSSPLMGPREIGPSGAVSTPSAMMFVSRLYSPVNGARAPGEVVGAGKM